MVRIDAIGSGELGKGESGSNERVKFSNVHCGHFHEEARCYS
jgi:cobalamin biosynthesis protein CbiG